MMRAVILGNPQKALLHVAKSKLKSHDAACRQILARVAGVTSGHNRRAGLWPSARLA